MSVFSFSNFDISTVPKDTVFVLDTNVLYYVHSGYYLPNNHKLIDYSNLIQKLLTGGYNVAVSALSVQELLFGIENKEYKIYCDNNGLTSSSYSKKDFRKNINQKAAIKNKFKTVLAELATYDMQDGTVKFDTINDFIGKYESHKMDPIDFILANNYDSNKTIFVSEDKDFKSLTSINVLMA